MTSNGTDECVVLDVKLRLVLDVCAPGERSPRAVIEEAVSHLQVLLEHGTERDLADMLTVKVIDRYPL